MKEYQKKQASVKESIEVLDTELLMALASEGLLALSLRVGLEVFRQMLDTDVEELAGARGTHNPDRKAYRHGTEATRVVMGGQKVTAQRPRVRSKDGAELQLPTLGLFQNEDPLNRVNMSLALNTARRTRCTPASQKLDTPVAPVVHVESAALLQRLCRTRFSQNLGTRKAEKCGRQKGT